jgi:hypothetical protein
MNKKCIICNSENGKYKCRFCQSAYCSINCHKEHNKQCNEKNVIKNENEDNEENNKIQPLNLDEDEDIILSEKQLSCLKSNKSITTKIKNKKLRKILKEIDTAKYKKRTLERYMKNDPDFKEFTTEILQTLGFIKNNEFVDKY